MTYRTLVITEHELGLLREALDAPQHQALLTQLPGLSAALQDPLPDIRPVLKAAIRAHAWQAVLEASHHEPGTTRSPDDSELKAARVLYDALTEHLANLDSAVPADTERAHP